ncbi:MAG: 16S rRNA (adenine(1518)-N(6)/adenine(1519)-N(6))-dimethyltransferase RsmA [Candidatus Paceibacterota bacterium]
MFKRIRAKKSLGQNFLKNKSKLRKIAEVLELKKGDTVIEIGPGHGELTREIRNKSKEIRIIAIEKDVKLAEFLRKEFSEDKKIEIVEGDALKVLKSYVLDLKSYKIAGNIPYYITGYLLRIISELKTKPDLTVLTIQKEVAQRICAQAPDMNLLAASVQFWADPKIISYISKKDFVPVPKVDSAIIRLRIKNKEIKIKDSDYYAFIKVLFKQPRKTIINNLSPSGKKEEILKTLLKTGIKPGDRPQNLNIEQIKKLI